MELELVVEDYGCVVVGPVASCDAALDLLKSRSVDAAILDLVIRDENCDPVVDELNARSIPWALSTGMDVTMLDHRYQAVPLIAKPFARSEVEAVLGKLIGPKPLKPTHPTHPNRNISATETGQTGAE